MFSFTTPKIKDINDVTKMFNEFDSYILDNPDYNLLYNYAYINDKLSFIENTRLVYLEGNEFFRAGLYTFVEGRDVPQLKKIFYLFLEQNEYIYY